MYSGTSIFTFRACVIKLITAVINDHMTVKYVSVLKKTLNYRNYGHITLIRLYNRIMENCHFSVIHTNELKDY